ncbi:MAG: carbohydrate kinase family protein [Thiotrichales bacterium]|nr:carbohydrate kinase family protein [Thiotrichales bacterium]
MSALICGSVAYDTIMVFEDRFRNHILPDRLHMLSVSFQVPQLRREFGGCAGNIAYNLKLLGGNPLPMATVGKDFDPYARWMDECGVDHRHVTRIDTEYTAQAFITTDLDDNQITAFHPGAMNSAHLNDVRETSGVTIGIVAPDGREAMIEHASQFAECGIPFIFDLGQGMPLFDGDDLRRFIDLATWLTFNDYEWEVVRERTGLDAAAVASKVEALIVTRGARGSVVHTRGATIEIPPARTSGAVDPTGCGDAYRAGILHGLMNDLDWETTGRLASLMGALKIERHGTQNHRCTRAEIDSRFRESFGRSL